MLRHFTSVSLLQCLLCFCLLQNSKLGSMERYDWIDLVTHIGKWLMVTITYRRKGFFSFFIFFVHLQNRQSWDWSMYGCNVVLTLLGAAGWRPSARQPVLQQSWPNQAGSLCTADPKSCPWLTGLKEKVLDFSQKFNKQISH